MKSVKPGRGPSMMGGVSSLAMGVFGLVWTVGAASIGAPAFMVAFGVVFIVIAIVQAIYAFMNATRKNRFSAFDIVDGDEEPDPLNARAGTKENAAPAAFCPYCGEPIAQTDHLYCGKCGRRRMPE